MPRSRDNKLLIFIALEIPALAPAPAPAGYDSVGQRKRERAKELSWVGVLLKDKAHKTLRYARGFTQRVYFSLGRSVLGFVLGFVVLMKALNFPHLRQRT